MKKFIKYFSLIVLLFVIIAATKTSQTFIITEPEKCLVFSQTYEWLTTFQI